LDTISASAQRARAVSAVGGLRLAGIVEGLSYLLLLFIAMPLKYVFELPLAVRIVGSVHGALFVWFCVALLRAHLERSWPLKTSALLFISSLVPFGFFLVERRLKEDLATLGAAVTSPGRPASSASLP
jgi:integral membrane protein